MTPDQTAALLAYASAADPRIRRKDPDELLLQIRFWHGQLADVDPDAARRAVEAHYAQPGVDAILPGDVRAGAHGPAADRHPSARPLRQAIAEADAAAGASTMPALPAAPADRAAAEAAKARVAAVVEELARRRAVPPAEAWARPIQTGYIGRRHRPAPPRGARKNVALTDRAGRAITICHTCAADIPAPDGWNPADPDAPPLHCGRCREDGGGPA